MISAAVVSGLEESVRATYRSDPAGAAARIDERDARRRDVVVGKRHVIRNAQREGEK